MLTGQFLEQLKPSTSLLRAGYNVRKHGQFSERSVLKVALRAGLTLTRGRRGARCKNPEDDRDVSGLKVEFSLLRRPSCLV